MSLWNKNAGGEHRSIVANRLRQKLKDMRLKHRFALGTSRKFLRRLYLWISLTTLFLIAFLSYSVFWNVERIVLMNEQHNNNKIIGQIQYNIASMYDNIKNMANSIYYNSEAQSIMYAQNERDIYQIILKMGNFRQLVSYNQFLHSILIYNGSLDRFYSTFNGLYEKNASFDDLVSSNPMQMRLRLVPRTFNQSSNESGADQVLSLMVFETLNHSGKPDGAVIVNVKPQWLQDNINFLNGIGTKPGVLDKVYIVDAGGKLLFGNVNAGDDTGTRFINSLGTLGHGPDGIQTFKRSFEGRTYLVTLASVPQSDWSIVKVQDFSIFDPYVNKIKTTVIVVALVFILLSVVASLIVSRRVYRPLGNLVQEISSVDEVYRLAGPPGIAISEMDEIQQLRSVYRQSEYEIDAYRQKQISVQPVMKAYYLRRILLDSRAITSAQWEEIGSSSGLFVELERSLRVGVVRIDRYAEFGKRLSRDRELCKFAIENVMGECLARHAACDLVDMKEDQLAFLVHAIEDEASLLVSIRISQQFLSDRYGLSLTVSFSRPVTRKLELQDAYEEAYFRSFTRFAFGHGVVITPEMTDEAEREETIDYSRVKEKALAEALASGNEDAIERELDQGLSMTALQHPRHTRIYFMHWAYTFVNVIMNVNRIKLEPANLNIDLIVRELLDCETREEATGCAMDCVRTVLAHKTNREAKYQLLVDAMKDLAVEHYGDPEWFLQNAAEHLKISSAFAGKLFKEYIGATYVEYVNDLRLEKAAELLQYSRLKIADIMEQVGIPNKSYFFRIFKRKFGATPKEYTLKKTLTNLHGPE